MILGDICKAQVRKQRWEVKVGRLSHHHPDLCLDRRRGLLESSWYIYLPMFVRYWGQSYNPVINWISYPDWLYQILKIVSLFCFLLVIYCVVLREWGLCYFQILEFIDIFVRFTTMCYSKLKTVTTGIKLTIKF